jgi:hypothetical protein
MNDLESSYPIFEEDEIAYPGFVEFDSFNHRVIISEGKQSRYKIRDLQTFELLAEISSTGILDLKMSPNALVIIRRMNPAEVSITLCGEQEEVAVSLPLYRRGEIEIVERNEFSVAIKQSQQDLIIHNLVESTSTAIPETWDLLPDSFVFLNDAKRIAIYINGEFRIYSFQGAYLFTITSGRRLSVSPMATSQDQRFLAALTQDEFDQWINLFSLEDGVMLFETHIPPNQNNGHLITNIAFDETTNILITGTEMGIVDFWG